jgi:anti-anti-sigma factor
MVQRMLNLSVKTDRSGTVRIEARGTLVFGEDTAVLRGTLRRLAPAHRDVIIDLSAVSRLDAAAIGVLAAAHAEAQDSGGRLQILHARPHAHRMLQIANLDSRLCASPGRAEPRESIGAPMAICA